MNITAVIRGGGDLGTGVAYHLRKMGVRVIITELDNPKMVRHPVCLGYAAYNGVQRVEDMTARLMSLNEAAQSWEQPRGGVWDEIIPVVIDGEGKAIETLHPAVVCDCRMLKEDVADERDSAPVTIGLGPGFCAACRWLGESNADANVDCVVETQRGEHLGEIITSGRALPNTGVPGVVGGESSRRLLRAPQAGLFRGVRRVGAIIDAGTIVGYVGELPVVSAIGGRLRGLVHDGLEVRSGEKIGDCDPRGAAVSAYRISDKSHATGRAVASWLQALPETIKTSLREHEERVHPHLSAYASRSTNDKQSEYNKAKELNSVCANGLNSVCANGLNSVCANGLNSVCANGLDAPCNCASNSAQLQAAEIVRELTSLRNEKQAQHHLRFFKTAPGQYGAGDRFLGLTVPQTRLISKKYAKTSLETIALLLDNEYHEVRLCALQLLVQLFRRDKRGDRSEIIALYLAMSARVNNWDLVDLSVCILGEWLEKRDRSLLYSLAHSDCLWCRRMAMVGTHTLIKAGEITEALDIAALLLPESEDLLHKAVGWMLREVGKRDAGALKGFLRANYEAIPRTALRYAIEKFPEDERRDWLQGSVQA